VLTIVLRAPHIVHTPKRPSSSINAIDGSENSVGVCGSGFEVHVVVPGLLADWGGGDGGGIWMLLLLA